LAIDHIFPIIYDYLVNRISGVYIGSKPKNPNKLIIPQFVVIQKTSFSTIDLLTSKLTLQLLKRPLIISDKNTWKIAGEKLFEEFISKNIFPEKYIASSNKYSEVIEAIHGVSKKPRFWKRDKEALGNHLYSKKQISIVISAGGGMVVDFGKLLAKIMNVPFISIPTSLANDGIASPFAVIDSTGYSDTAFQKSMETFTPLGVIINISSIKYSSSNASDGFLRDMIRSGIGDVLSKVTACLDWQLAYDQKMAEMDYLAFSQSSSAGEAILAKIDLYDDILEDDFLLYLGAALTTSGEAMTRVSSSRPASGFEHKFYHAYNMINGKSSPVSHGMLVAIGALISAKAHGAYYDQLKRAYKKVGLPTTVEDLEALSVTEKRVVEAIGNAHNVKPDRYTILEHVGPDKLIESYYSAFSST
jgi:glycerol-1-phosphate dehydrogenase [NAD(P)+]